MKRNILFWLSIMLIFSLNAQKELYLKKQLIHKTDTLPYRILYPENYDKTQKYPLFLFLHGAGERGNDNERQLVHGSGLFTDSLNRKLYPAIVIFPQCAENGYWAPISTREGGFDYTDAKKATPQMLMVIRLLNHIQKTESIDKNRIYVGGLSMGGMGTFDLICRKPNLFAAAVPICGGVEVTRLKKATKIPIRMYHGGADNVVSPEHSRNAYIELKARGAQDVELFIFPGVGHNSWTNAFEQNDFLSWIFSQKKK